MTAQASLFEFVPDAAEVIDVIPKDRFAAPTHEEFISLSQQLLGRKPNAPEWQQWWTLHPDEFERKHGEPWKVAKARGERWRREADRKTGKRKRRGNGEKESSQ